MSSMPSQWILHLEDDDSDAALVRRFFRPWAEAEVVRLERGIDGDHALEIFRKAEEAPRLAILDLKTPKKNGFDVLRSLPERGERAFPVVVFTSSAEPRDIAQCKELGCDAYYTKPVDYGEFKAAVEEIFTRFLS